jgi:hypothetical protein
VRRPRRWSDDQAFKDIVALKLLERMMRNGLVTRTERGI